MDFRVVGVEYVGSGFVESSEHPQSGGAEPVCEQTESL